MKFEVDKAAMVDSGGRFITQGLFLELGYGDFAIYTMKDNHYEYKGKVYPSLKKLFIEFEDPTEYDFANKYLVNWKHWQRLYQNKAIRPYIDEMREELDLKVRAQAYRDMLALSTSESGNFSATKWLADRGWDKRQAGRPSKAEKEKEQRIADRLAEEFDADSARLRLVDKG